MFNWSSLANYALAATQQRRVEESERAEMNTRPNYLNVKSNKKADDAEKVFTINRFEGCERALHIAKASSYPTDTERAGEREQGRDGGQVKNAPERAVRGGVAVDLPLPYSRAPLSMRWLITIT